MSDLGEDVPAERMIFDLIGWNYAAYIPTVNLDILPATQVFNMRHPLDRIRNIEASAERGKFVSERSADEWGTVTDYSPSHRFDMHRLNGPEDNREYYGFQGITSDFALRHAREWFHRQGVRNATVRIIKYYSHQQRMSTTWKSFMLHRREELSALKRELREFHRRYQARSHPAILMLEEVDIAGERIMAHDDQTLTEVILPAFDNLPLRINFWEGEHDYHQDIIRILKRMGARI